MTIPAPCEPAEMARFLDSYLFQPPAWLIDEVLTFDDDGVSLRLDGFTPPLSALATHSVEELRFTPEGDATHVERSMALHAKRWWSYPLLWLISWFVGAALRRHLRSL